MNNYGQPSGPEVAMLDELHRLWARVFGRRADQPQAKRGQRLPLLALVVVAAAVVVRVAVF